MSLRAMLAYCVFVPVLDFLQFGVEPSSSHTAGPLRAAAGWLAIVENVALIDCIFFGSLGAADVGNGKVSGLLAFDGASFEVRLPDIGTSSPSSL